MKVNIKVGDLVETCSLLPGVVMSIDHQRDDIRVRMLDVDEYLGDDVNKSFASCSPTHCGIVKLTAKQALKRLQLGKEKLGELWDKSQSYEEYVKLVDQD